MLINLKSIDTIGIGIILCIMLFIQLRVDFLNTQANEALKVSAKKYGVIIKPMTKEERLVKQYHLYWVFSNSSTNGKYVLVSYCNFQHLPEGIKKIYVGFDKRNAKLLEAYAANCQMT